MCFVARDDMFTKRGGDTILCELYANMMKASGWEVDFWVDKRPFVEADFYHAFNIDRPLEIYPKLKKAVLQNRKFAITSLHHPWEWVEKFRVDAIGVESLGRMFYSSPLGRNTRHAEYFKEFIRMGLTRSFDKSVLCVSWLGRAKWIIDNASGILLQSNAEESYIEKDFGVSGIHSKCFVVPNPAMEQDDSVISLDCHETDILFVGRIEVRKNPLSLLHAAIASKRRLRLIGKANPNEKSYFQLILKLVTENEGIELIQGVTRAELQQHYRRAKLLVNPSYVEVSPIVDVEGLANKCPLVTTKYALHHEFLPKGVGICDPYSIDSLVDVLQGSYSATAPACVPSESECQNNLIVIYNHLVYGKSIKDVV